MADHLQPLNRTQLAADSYAAVMATASAALVRSPIMRSVGGGAAFGMGAANLLRRDEAHISTVGSFGQMAGGLTLALTNHAEAVPRAAAAVVAGSLLNQVETHVNGTDHPMLRSALRGAIFTGAAGVMLAGRETDPRALLVMAGIGAGVAAVWTGAIDSSGPRPMSGDMARLGLQLRAMGH